MWSDDGMRIPGYATHTKDDEAALPVQFVLSKVPGNGITYRAVPDITNWVNNNTWYNCDAEYKIVPD